MIALALYAVIFLSSSADLIERAALRHERRGSHRPASYLLAASVIVAGTSTVLLLVTLALDALGVWT